MPKGDIGIEIGARQVKMIFCENHGFCREEVEPLPERCVKDGISMSVEVMAGFLKKMAKTYGFKCRSCCLVLPDHVTFTRRLTMPAMSVKHLKLNLPYEFHDFVGNKKEAYLFDYAVMDMRYDERKQPVSMDLMAAAVSKRTMEEYRQMLRLAGWKLKAAAPAAFAYSGLIREYEERRKLSEPGEYCFVDLGYKTTKVWFFHGKALEAYRRIENCLVKGSGQTFYDAIGTEIRRTLEFYYFRNPDKRFAKMYLCGGGSRVEAFRDTVAEYTLLTPEDAGHLVFFADRCGTHPQQALISPAAVGVTFCR